MANRERGEFALAVGDQRYTLRLTTNACAELEDFTEGRTIEQILFGVLKRHSIKDMRLLLWAALRDRHPDVATTDPGAVTAIGALVDKAGGFRGMSDQLKAFAELNQNPEPSKPEEKKEGAADPPPAQAPDGEPLLSTLASSV